MGPFQFALENRVAMVEEIKCGTKKSASGVKEPVMRVRLSTKQESKTLAAFGSELEAHYFNPDGPRDLADGMPLRDTNEVFPHKRGESMSGALAKIDFGIGPPMQFLEASLDDFALHPMNGSIVIYFFWLEIRPDEVQAGKLYMLQEREVNVTIEPAELPSLPLKAAA